MALLKVLGIITEYNPFHNGHLYHIEKSRQVTNADFIVCIMSGNYIQRGEPAIVNKWARTKMALSAGIDLVIELPSVYALSSAEYFAFGAVKLLNSLGITDYICFGSESGEISQLRHIAEILANEPACYKDMLFDNLRTGISYPASRSDALQRYLSLNWNKACDVNELISSPNNILGVEYIKALIRLKSNIKPLSIKRIGNSYNSSHITGQFASATSIRTELMQHVPLGSKKVKETLPQFSLDVLNDEFSNGRGPIFPNIFERLILACFRNMPVKNIQQLPYVSEGLENRIKSAAKTSTTLEEFLSTISTRRYTRTRLQRIMYNALGGITSAEFELFNKNGGPQYIRVLGFSKSGQELLSIMKKSATLPVITKTANLKYQKNHLSNRMFEIENILTDLYVLGYENPLYRKGGQEYTQNVIMIN